MNKLIFLIFTVALTNGLYGQKSTEHVVSNSYIISNTISRSFGFINVNLDTCRYKLIKYWGTPIQNTTGIIMWKNIEIPDIGKKLRIHLVDKLCTKENRIMTCKSFIDEKDKIEKLANQTSNQFRVIEITITNRKNKNIIADTTMADIIVQLLEKIMQ